MAKETGGLKCTALVVPVQRIARNSNPLLKLVVVVADGEETRVKTAIPAIAAPVSAPAVLMVLVGGHGPGGNSYGRFEYLQKSWRQAAPWIDVIPASDVVGKLQALTAKPLV